MTSKREPDQQTLDQMTVAIAQFNKAIAVDLEPMNDAVSDAIDALQPILSKYDAVTMIAALDKLADMLRDNVGPLGAARASLCTSWASALVALHDMTEAEETEETADDA